MPEWCILQHEEMPLKHKSLAFNTLQKPLIFRVFAPEGKSVRKYSLIFRGRTENSDVKIKNRFQFESYPYRPDFRKRKNTYSEILPQHSTSDQAPPDLYRIAFYSVPPPPDRAIHTEKAQKTARSRPSALLLAAHKYPVPDGIYGLFAVVLV